MKPITKATTFMVDNLTDPVCRLGTRPDGKAFYRTVGGILYELDETQLAVLDRYQFKIRMTPELAGDPAPKNRLPSVQDVLDKLAVDMDGPLNAIDRLRAFSAGLSDPEFAPEHAEEIIDYLGILADAVSPPANLHAQEHVQAGTRYLNTADGKIYVFVSEADGLVAFKREGSEIFRYLSHVEFHNRFFTQEEMR